MRFPASNPRVRTAARLARSAAAHPRSLRMCGEGRRSCRPHFLQPGSRPCSPKPPSANVIQQCRAPSRAQPRRHLQRPLEVFPSRVTTLPPDQFPGAPPLRPLQEPSHTHPDHRCPQQLLHPGRAHPRPRCAAGGLSRSTAGAVICSRGAGCEVLRPAGVPGSSARQVVCRHELTVQALPDVGAAATLAAARRADLLVMDSCLHGCRPWPAPGARCTGCGAGAVCLALQRTAMDLQGGAKVGLFHAVRLAFCRRRGV